VRTAPSFLALVPLGILAAAACAAPIPPIVHGRPRPWQPPAAATRAGMRVALDPATGELVTPSAHDPALAGITRTVDRNTLTIRTRTDGSSFVVLDGRIRDYVIVSQTPSGAWRQECIQTRLTPLSSDAACVAGTGVQR